MVADSSASAELAPMLLQDRTLSASVSMVKVCPSMDLLAVVLDKVSVAIFRSSWQRLATIPVSTEPDHHITAIDWSPDGANLVVAVSSGELAILSVDRSAFASTAKAKRAARDTAGPVAGISLPAPVQCLAWVSAPPDLVDEELQSNYHYEDRAARLIHATTGHVLRRPGLIFCGDRDGYLSIMSQDLHFTIARVHVMPHGFLLNGLRLHPELQYCLVFGHDSREDALDSRTSASDARVSCFLRSVDLKHLLEFWSEISRIGSEVVAITNFMQELESASKKVKECWVEGGGETMKNSVLNPLSKSMRDFAENRSIDPCELLQYAFCGGSVTGALLQFLAADLTENRAKEVLRAFRSNVDDLSDALHRLIPMAENIVVRAVEYRALSSLSSRYGPVGVYANDTEELFTLAEDLYLSFGEMTWEVEKVSAEIEAFLAWLVIAAARAGGESSQARTNAAMSCLKGEDGKLVSNFFQRFISKGSSGAGSSPWDTVKEMYKDRILPAIHKYQSLCQKMHAEPSAAISSSLAVDEGVVFSIAAPGISGAPRFSISPVADIHGSGAQMHVCVVTGEGNVISTCYDGTEHKWFLSHWGFLSEKRSILDVSTLNDSSLMFLTSDLKKEDVTAGDGKCSCHLSIHAIEGCISNAAPIDNLHEKLEGRGVRVPEVSQYEGKTRGGIEVDQMANVSATSVSIYCTGTTACIINKPRRVLLFQV